MLGVASEGLVAPPGLLDRPSDLSQLGVNAAVGSKPGSYRTRPFPGSAGTPRALRPGERRERYLRVVPQTSKTERVGAAARQDRCPQCWSVLGSGRVGSGRLSDGVFCNLTCLSTFHARYFDERVKGAIPSEN